MQFMLVTHQLGNAQHRFLVPLWDPRVPNLLERLEPRAHLHWRAGATPNRLVLSLCGCSVAQRLRNHLDMCLGLSALQALQQMPRLDGTSCRT